MRKKLLAATGLAAALALAAPGTAYAEGELCPVLALMAPGIPGVSEIDSTGDTYILFPTDPLDPGSEKIAIKVWDCPPYEDQ